MAIQRMTSGLYEHGCMVPTAYDCNGHHHRQFYRPYVIVQCGERGKGHNNGDEDSEEDEAEDDAGLVNVDWQLDWSVTRLGEDDMKDMWWTWSIRLYD